MVVKSLYTDVEEFFKFLLELETTFLLEMYKEVIETLTALEEQKEEEPKEELTEEQKYIKKLEAEVKALRSEREKINKRKYNNNVKYYKIPSIPKSFPFWF